ncbi:hypothetical protein HY375_00155 [Candidatus Berkelbacteria bacterium]|nr:hypothetical protein [Candidatus Berkelbacteria bacterium]
MKPRYLHSGGLAVLLFLAVAPIAWAQVDATIQAVQDRDRAYLGQLLGEVLAGHEAGVPLAIGGRGGPTLTIERPIGQTGTMIWSGQTGWSFDPSQPLWFVRVTNVDLTQEPRIDEEGLAYLVTVLESLTGRIPACGGLYEWDGARESPYPQIETLPTDPAWLPKAEPDLGPAVLPTPLLEDQGQSAE